MAQRARSAPGRSATGSPPKSALVVPAQVVAFVRSGLEPLANPSKGRGMAAYLKTLQPFLGVQKPGRDPVFQEMCRSFPPADASAYRSTVLALWQAGTVEALDRPDDAPKVRRDTALSPPMYQGPRELMYAACAYAERFKDHHTPAHLPLFKRLIEEGGWWDIVDWVSDKMVGSALLRHRAGVAPVLRKWIKDENLWLRRAAVISQLSHKGETDAAMLQEFILECADEQDFFMRKAIGWALRQHARTDPAFVRAFLTKHKSRLSTLSLREAGKHL